MYQHRQINLLIAAATFTLPLLSCTIFCAKDKHGHVWAGNNEDFYWFDFSTRIRILPKTDTSLSFIYFYYSGMDFPQGGVNEAGLFYDANMVEPSETNVRYGKPNYPGGTGKLMIEMLGRCKTVPEVLNLFDRYNVPELNRGQIHLADKQGNMGIITVDSAWLTSENFQVSTNYNLSHVDDDYKRCWRYPIAYSMLTQNDPTVKLMTDICDYTCQRKGVSTIYSNVHNLNTGEIWLYYGWDYKNPFKTTFDQFMALGDTTILIRQLFDNDVMVKAYNAFTVDGFDEALKILNIIQNEAVREEKQMLLTQGVLFDFQSFLTSEEILISQDEQLVRRVIEASQNAEILSAIANQKISKANKNLVDEKLQVLKGSAITGASVLGVVLLGVFVTAVVVSVLIKLESRRKSR